MCFSAEASFVAGTVLVPAGVYCVVAASRKDRAYLAVAAIPLLFAAQQFAEAGVWAGLTRGQPELVKPASLIFLFFVLAFWPFWVAYSVTALEDRPFRRLLLVGISELGLVLGCVAFIPVALGFDADEHVEMIRHSIRYNFDGLPPGEAIRMAFGPVWLILYLAAVTSPLLLSRDPRLRVLGLGVAASAVVSHFVFWYAFASVWCFFAAGLSLIICYAIYRLPPVALVESSVASPQPSST